MPEPQLGPIPSILFFSRWLQASLHVGLIVAQGVCAWNLIVPLAEDRR